MAEEPDHIILTMLREMRAENRLRFDRIEARFDEVDERLDTLEKQMMGVSSILMLIHGEQLTLEGRVEALETPEPAE